MLKIWCSWEELRRLHREQPNLDHHDEIMFVVDLEEVLMNTVVKGAEEGYAVAAPV